MQTIEHSAYLDFSAEQMYCLANDVANYPEFLPWCSATHVLEENDSSMTASITVKKGFVEQTFTTDNLLVENQSILMKLRKGPFKTMMGEWQFVALGEGASKVCFQLKFEFDSRLLSMTLGPVFTKIADTMIEAFVERAKQVYGVRGEN